MAKKKCFMCNAPVENELIQKDGNFFCTNDCECEYWNNYVDKSVKR